MHLFIATPAFKGECYIPYAKGIIQLGMFLRARRISHEFKMLSDTGNVVSARETLVKLFLNSTGTHLIFIDADIGFKPEDVLKIASSEIPVYGATYPFKRYPLEVVSGIPTGFLCIQRKVFEILRPPYFRTMVHKNKYLSEDYAFIVRCEASRIPVGLCKEIQLTHTGTHTFVKPS